MSLSNVDQQTANLPADVSSINNQLESLRISLLNTQATVNQTREALPMYFGQANTVLIVLAVLVNAFGVLLLLIGYSIMTLRRGILKNEIALETLRRQLGKT